MLIKCIRVFVQLHLPETTFGDFFRRVLLQTSCFRALRVQAPPSGRLLCHPGKNTQETKIKLRWGGTFVVHS